MNEIIRPLPENLENTPESPLELRKKALAAKFSPERLDIAQHAIGLHLFDETWTNLAAVFEGSGAIKIDGTMVPFQYIPNTQKTLTRYQDEYRRNTVNAIANIANDTASTLAYSTNGEGRPEKIVMIARSSQRPAFNYVKAVTQVADRHLPDFAKEIITPNEFALEFLAGVADTWGHGKIPPRK